METPTSSHTTIAKKVLHMLKIAYYMLRKGISKHKLTMDLHLLLKRGKLAGKFIITNLIHHHAVSGSSSSSPYSSLSCKFMDPDTAYYNPRREVEFSCSNTPRISKKKARRDEYYSYETHQAAAILRALEMMNDHELRHSPVLGFGRSPRVVRQLRVTDSPFPVKEEEEVVDDDERVDKEAEEFIRRFYEELRMQERTAAATPEYCYRFSRRG